MATTQSEVKALFDRQFEAIRIKDLDRLMSHYAGDVVYFDVVPPLQYAGAAALRRRFSEWFDGYQGTIDLDVRELKILESRDLAVAHWFSRARGTLTNGREVGSWVRASSCCRWVDGQWLVTHEHISLPVDVKTGSAVIDLAP